MDKKIFRIVLSGGICAGKSTSFSKIYDHFTAAGFNVFLIPEVVTLMILGGINIRDSKNTYYTQTAILKTQLYLEKMFLDQAKLNDKPSIIISDRGTMDGSAFTPSDIWQAVLDENGWTKVGLRDKHYEAIIHLVSAAVGAEEFYTLENNKARTETLEQARENEFKIREVWVGHPHLRIIDNSTAFKEKIDRVISAICDVVGIPEPIETERKFLVTKIGDFGDIKKEIINIEQTYLKSNDGIERVRKRGQDGSFSYTHTIKYNLSAGKNIEKERLITAHEYLNLLKRANPEKLPIIKTRTCFLYDHHYFELDYFISPPKDLIMLEIEVEENVEVKLPSFLTIEREVTKESKYSNAELAKI